MSKACCICILSFVSWFTSNAQNSPQQTLDSLSGSLVTSLRAGAAEKAYVLVDKNIFNHGESLLYRALLLNSVSQKPSGQSHYLFADVVDRKDSVWASQILNVETQQLEGKINLPTGIPTGDYWLRCYTLSMARAGTGHAAIHPIFVYGDAKPKNNRQEQPAGTSDSIPKVNFYPEGGSMMTGASSVVGVQASYNGKPVQLAGLVQTGTGAAVTTLKTNEMGLGKFVFEPAGRRTYKAVIEWNGKELNYPLPRFNFFGGQIAVSEEGNNYRLRVLLEDSIFTPSALTYVVGLSRDSVIFAGIGKGLYEAVVPKEKVPAGIATFYLFDKDLRLLSERSIYSRGNLALTAQLTSPQLGRRDKGELTFGLSSSRGEEVSSLMAISIADSSLLSAGEVCPPSGAVTPAEIDNWFFLDHTCLTERDIDLFMLLKSHTYESISTKKDGQNGLSDENYLSIRGTMYQSKNTPLPNQPVMLVAAGLTGMLNVDTTDASGHFVFDVVNLQDSTEFVVKPISTASRKFTVTIDSLRFPKFRTPDGMKQPLNFESAAINKRMNAFRNMDEMGKTILPPVVVGKKANEVDYDVSKRVSSYSAILSGKDLDERTSVGNAILRVPGVHMLNGVLVIGGLSSLKAPDPTSEPLLMVDGTQAVLSPGSLSDGSPTVSFLNTFNPTDIDFIEILRGAEAANYGLRGGNGVILINTKNGHRSLNSENVNQQIFYATGVYAARGYSFAGYPDDEKKNSPAPDLRSVLYWNGSKVIPGTTTQGNTITFYPGDVRGVYGIEVTAITGYGDLLKRKLYFRVK